MFTIPSSIVLFTGVVMANIYTVFDSLFPDCKYLGFAVEFCLLSNRLLDVFIDQ